MLTARPSTSLPPRRRIRNECSHVRTVTPSPALEGGRAVNPDLTLPSLDVPALARRAALPAAVAVAIVIAVVVAGGPLQAFAHALDRAVHANPLLVMLAAGFELLSFTGYVMLLWLVAGRATPRIGIRESVEVTLGGAAATRLLPTAGVGGAALTLWALRRTGLDAARAGRTLLTFLVLLYAVFLGSVVVAGTLLALHAADADAPVTLTALPAALAGIGIALSLAFGLTRRRAAARGPEVARDDISVEAAAGRIRAGARLLGDAVLDAIGLVRSLDPRLAGALAWWAFDAAVLWAMLHAFGTPPSLLVLALAYFVGQAGNTLPIPGAVSGGIVGILLAFGVEADLAIVSVLGYRAVAIWLPAPIGLAALTSLRATLTRWAAEGARG
jgi:uncharacterized membrane protein YbhN (UPF0104 family)